MSGKQGLLIWVYIADSGLSVQIESLLYEQMKAVSGLTTLWADSVDDKLMIFFLFFLENRI